MVPEDAILQLKIIQKLRILFSTSCIYDATNGKTENHIQNQPVL